MLQQVRPHAAVITFQDGFNGYDGTADTYIHTKYSRAIQNYGAFGWTMAATPDARFQAGLIRFDDIFGSGASQIPAGSDHRQCLAGDVLDAAGIRRHHQYAWTKR